MTSTFQSLLSIIKGISTAINDENKPSLPTANQYWLSSTNTNRWSSETKSIQSKVTDIAPKTLQSNLQNRLRRSNPSGRLIWWPGLILTIQRLRSCGHLGDVDCWGAGAPTVISDWSFHSIRGLITLIKVAESNESFYCAKQSNLGSQA